jgi:hypothetical protein
MDEKKPVQAQASQPKIVLRPTEFYYRRAMERSAEIKRETSGEASVQKKE